MADVVNKHELSKCGCCQLHLCIGSVIILLLLFIVWQNISVERYYGAPYANTLYTSGADQRFAQVETSTDQAGGQYKFTPL
jgi:hypothetical protein